jgi:hypothetical protein
MTWVVGMPSMFGHAFAVSDIQVSWPNGRTLDCLQKLYPLGRWVAGGFAGSVELGFFLLGDLSRGLAQLPPGQATSPIRLALKWHRRARYAFKHVKRVQDLGCQIILVGVSPQRNNGDSPWALSHAIAMRSPDFTPEFAQFGKCVSIGSGAAYAPYKPALEDTFSLSQMEVGMPGGSGFALLTRVWATLEQHPLPGVSRHAHLLVVERGAFKMHTSDRTEVPREGPEIFHRMPPVAQSWPEFVQMASAQGLPTATACC